MFLHSCTFLSSTLDLNGGLPASKADIVTITTPCLVPKEAAEVYGRRACGQPRSSMLQGEPGCAGPAWVRMEGQQVALGSRRLWEGLRKALLPPLPSGALTTWVLQAAKGAELVLELK